MARMKAWNVYYDRYNPQFRGPRECKYWEPVMAATAQSAVNKLNKKFEASERRGAYGHNVATRAELA